MRSVDCVLFDLDGTLIDSVPDIAYCIDLMRAELGLSPPGEARVRTWVGNGAERLVHRALTDTFDGVAEASLFDRGFDLFSQLYQEHTSRLSRLYDGTLGALNHLVHAGYKLGCVTNKRGRYTEPLLDALGILGHFRIVVSGDTLPQKKPDPEPLLYAAEMLGAAPERTLMVGDSLNDIQAARAADLPVYCVTYGYNHGRDIREHAPDRVLNSLAELPALL